MHAIGIDLGGTNIKAALVDKNNGIIDQISVPTEADQGKNHVFDRVRDVVNQLIKINKTDPVGIGMGTPGMVSLDRTTVKNPPNLPGWEVENVSDQINKRTGLPCIIDNDANLAALGSSRFGVGKQFDSFILITLGTGVGGGIIFNKHLFRGTTGAAAELGHVTINYKGPYSNSTTRGNIEAYLGQRFLSNHAVKIIQKHPENPLYEKFQGHFEDLEPVDLHQAAESGNPLAADILSKAGKKLGFALVNYIHILDIRKIILSGGVAKAGKWIIEPAKISALENLMPPFHDDFEILYEPLGNDAALYGASSLAFEQL